MISGEAIQAAAGKVNSEVEAAKARATSHNPGISPTVLDDATKDTENYHLEQEARRLLGRDTQTSDRPDQEIVNVMRQIREAMTPRMSGPK